MNPLVPGQQVLTHCGYKRGIRRRMSPAFAAFVAIIGWATCSSSPPAYAITVTLSASANIQAAVNANPQGTTFLLQPGVYRMQSVTPKTGDIFTGQTGADLNGSQILTQWARSGTYWVSRGAPALNSPIGSPSATCSDPTTGCAYPQDLFFNDKPLIHKLSLPISLGQWYFDYTNDAVYTADNPGRQTVELSVTSQAFSGYVDNVTIQNLIVEKYANKIMSGAIAPYGSNWTIESNEVRLNHGAGVKPQYQNCNYERILNNNVHDNGQEGIAVGGGIGTLVEYNTIAYNDYAYVLSEAGGGKIAATTNAQVLNNIYTDNNNVGLWGDSGSTGSIFSGNTITGSQLDGIRYEISHYGTISNNTLTNNAQDPISGICSNNAREIVLADSDNTQVSNNIITTNCAGITLTQGSRNREVNDHITDNTITYLGTARLANRIGGLNQHQPYSVFNPSNGNYFDYNIYHFVPSAPSLSNWVFDRADLSWSAWLASGEDIHSTAD
jgi:parallel beta-helix repeat protein